MKTRVQWNDDELTRVRSVFADAISLPSHEREGFLREATTGDPSLYDELASLLAAHEASDSFFDKLASELIAPALSAIEQSSVTSAEADGRSVSHYELIERIGSGAMGIVYKARDTRLDRTVALKFLPPHHQSNPAARARLAAEARSASQLDHPNIGTVYEIGEAEDGREFIAMAWYDGETLKDRIRREQIPLNEAVSIAIDLGNALSAAHGAGIVHRDVKPANVIITRRGSVKLVDFGIAKLMAEDDGERQVAAGTLAYMSPEQTRNENLDARTDIWSLGILLYEMLARQRPFRGDTDEGVVSAIISADPSPLTSLRKNLPANLVQVVTRCLQKDRSQRFQSAEEVCAALKAIAVNRNEGRERRLVFAAAALILTAGVASFVSQSSKAEGKTGAGIAVTHSIAVLAAAGGSDATQYLNDALAEDMRLDLSRFGSITVPSFLSSAAYVSTLKTTNRIGLELGSSYVVRTSATKSQKSILFDVLLIDVATGRQLLSQHYSTGADHPDVVREAVRAILASLKIPIATADRERLSHDRVAQMQAYDFYLRGLFTELAGTPRAAFATISRDAVINAQALYTQAIRNDPNFAPARARIAMSHIASTSFDTTQARLDQAKVEAQTALLLDPQLTDPHEALAVFWSKTGNPQKAIDQLEAVLQLKPGSASLRIALAQRYMESGRRLEAVKQFEHAARIDPRNPVALSRLSTAYGRMNRNSDARRATNRYIEAFPSDYEMRLIKGHGFLRSQGSADTLLAELKKLPPGWDDRGMATFAWYTALRAKRSYRDGLARLDSSKVDLSSDGLVYHPKSLMRADFYLALGDIENSRKYFREARATLQDSAAAHPSNANISSSLALAYAGLGQKRLASQEIQRAMALSTAARSGLSRTATMGTAVQVFGSIGDLDRAFQITELLLTMPAGREMTIAYLKAWPGFDPLRKDPRYDEVLQRFAVK